MNEERIIRLTSAELSTYEDVTDWERVSALTDADIERAITEDPDAAPILDEEFWAAARLLHASRFRSSEPEGAPDDDLR